MQDVTPGKVIQIKGSNASGKTTLIKQLMALSNDVYRVRDPATRKPYATVLYDLQWCIVGTYEAGKKMGGCDNLPTMDEIKRVLQELVVDYPGYWIAFEGMMISTTMTMYHYMVDLAKLYGIQPCVVVLQSTPEGCLKRIEQRRGSPLERTDLVVQKCELVLKHKYPPEHVVYLDVDKIAEPDMLAQFLKAVGDDLAYSYL